MKTWAVHIGGLVQGVGFRPFVSQLAEQMHLNGHVSNTNHGVYIHFNAAEKDALIFYNQLLKDPPVNAIIIKHELKEMPEHNFSGFSIIGSNNHEKPEILLTPDIALCSRCHWELTNSNNKRYQYPFITCLNCGPRYSIFTDLPYDRINTTMDALPMCSDCKGEYHDIYNPRHYSQTNSCPDCSIPMHLYNSNLEEIRSESEEILALVEVALSNGNIIAVKGIGGYLLLCDATNAMAIENLRDRKMRPAKPFALLYADLEMAEVDVCVSDNERFALQSKAAPIVLCQLKSEYGTGLCKELVAPGLNRIGIMLPYTGLLALLVSAFKKPLVATSGNINGSPIIYKDETALSSLNDFADLIVTFEREIVTPQDDSVLQFSSTHQQKIMIRRSRGYAPNYYPNPFAGQGCLLATGGEIKSAFALLDHQNLYVSQFLGDQENYDAQISFKKTAQHLIKILQCVPERILIDKHPHYTVSALGKNLADEFNIPFTEVQHHKAHFAAVLADNFLLQTSEPILGVIWDGTGYGDDEQIWGGEFFLLEDQHIERVAHFDYFAHLLGDKMSQEPRLSAVSLCREYPERIPGVHKQYNKDEWNFLQKMVLQSQHLLTSSMGRMLDGLASILNIQHFNTYEGEAAMKLEAWANATLDRSFDYYPIPIEKNRLDWRIMLDQILNDQKQEIPSSRIAYKIFCSLARCIRQVAKNYGVSKVAFSGGVFQNALLVDLITSLMQDDYQLIFHQQLSPNDECIGFGQIACYCLEHMPIKLSPKQSIYYQT